jgi:diaminopimelate epimerase
MRFTKMHGTGNDYVYVDAFSEQLPRADARMRMFNADGSEAEMCGNGIRCLAKYVYEHAICQRPTLQIETGAGILQLDLEIAAGRVHRVRVDMGEPIVAAARIPTTLPGDPVVNRPLTVGDRTWDVTCVSMGNPHCVTYVDQLDDRWVLELGPQVERHAAFPQRVNAEFVQVLSPQEVRQRTWERGSGETLACGTGASAVCVAGVLSGRTDRRLTVHLLGGDLELEWREDNNRVYMTGSATEVFTGRWPDA